MDKFPETLVEILDCFCENLISETVRNRIKTKYYNVFHLTDISNELFDEVSFLDGDLTMLSMRIKSDKRKFEKEERLKLAEKLFMHLKNIYNEGNDKETK